ncbi:hypothetical protein RKE25_20600 [Dyella sp. BiH032]|uniref:hypothetical protein n=1 Tax=Dyella sp. BiH032 TaxID=3075430 RepID=UPI0028931B0D|nr:hypothetical protein [Dyella sp. BiH032]WNL45782.1 hypothetical protein RKE25_20600 [Dyella sp. BiH032]
MPDRKSPQRVITMLGKTLTLCIAMLPMLPCASAEDVVKGIKLSSYELAAVTVATDRFRADGHKLDGYRLIVVERDEGIEVTFVPELIRSTNMVGFEKSSAPEIHYYLDATGSAIQRILLGQ